jgi:hypothetical protein
MEAPVESHHIDAIVAVVGTLLGGVVGAGLTFIQQRAQRAHDDRVRFHQARLDAYDKFYGAAMNLMHAASNWLGKSPREGALSDVIGKEQSELHTVFPRVRLVGSEAVVDAATELQQLVEDEPMIAALKSTDALLDAATPLVVKFESAVRKELGTDPNN